MKTTFARMILINQKDAFKFETYFGVNTVVLQTMRLILQVYNMSGIVDRNINNIFQLK